MTRIPETDATPNTSRIEQCIIHIGTEKTGTSAIQHYLRHAGRDLLEQGVLYPKFDHFEFDSQWEYVAAVHDQPWTQDVGRVFQITSKDTQFEFANALSAGLDQIIQNSPNAKTLIISSEHFHSRLCTVPMITRLKRFLSNWTDCFKIVVYFRRQDEVAVSFQSTRLKSAVKLTSEEMGTQQFGPSSYYDYAKVYKNWADVFGDAAMRPRIFNRELVKSGRLVHDFCETIGVAPPRSPVPVVNQSLSGKGFHFLQALNECYPVTPGDDKDKTRMELVNFISEKFPGRFSPMTREEAQNFYARFETTNEELRRLAFSDQEQPLFDSDFSEYPITKETNIRRYEEAVEIAVEIWMSRNQEPERKGLVSKLKQRFLDFIEL